MDGLWPHVPASALLGHQARLPALQPAPSRGRHKRGHPAERGPPTPPRAPCSPAPQLCHSSLSLGRQGPRRPRQAADRAPPPPTSEERRGAGEVACHTPPEPPGAAHAHLLGAQAPSLPAPSRSQGSTGRLPLCWQFAFPDPLKKSVKVCRLPTQLFTIRLPSSHFLLDCFLTTSCLYVLSC